jgi:peptide/nickel transport system substrate-binding protein
MNTHSSSSGFFIPKKDSYRKALDSFTPKQWTVFVLLFLGLAVTTLLLIGKVNSFFLKSIPAHGGSINAGVIGTPRFVNPVLAQSDAERDLTSLVFSGLMKKTSDGDIVPNLAESYEISKDGLTYTFVLKPGLTFHDGAPLSAEDVVYTINKIKNPTIKSPKKANWEGVGVTNADERTITFTLKQPFASFLENTTVGILPSHLFSNISDEEFNFSDLNTNAIGSGPFVVKKVNKNSSGIPSSFELKAFDEYVDGEPYISRYTFNFYPNEKELIKAYNNGAIEQINSISPDEAEKLKDAGAQVLSTPLPRIFGLFINQTEAPVFTDKNVVQAFNMAIDKKRIVDTVLHGYGKAINSPIPPTMIGEVQGDVPAQDKEGALALLKKSGWQLDETGTLVKKSSTIITPASKDKKTPAKTKESTTALEFSISTGDAPELSQAANLIKEDLESIGVRVEVKIFETGTLNQNVIRPRKYDMLLFGEIINRESDFFAFWHSSQRNDPGLNVALYANSKVDQLLEEASTTLDKATREQQYMQFEAEVKKDMPAIFLYSPDFIYIIRPDLQGFTLSHITIPSDRLLNAPKWYTAVDRVWPFFIHNQN